MSKQYLLVVNHILKDVVSSVDELKKNPEFSNLEILAITDKSEFNRKYSKYVSPKQVIHCNFQNPKDIADKLEPFIDNIVGVICRGEKHIQYLRKIAPILPPNINLSSADSLKRATNKRLMREAFIQSSPEITPKFLEVFDGSQQTIEKVQAMLKYPVIVKPANLYSSLLIQVCRDDIQLASSLSEVFKRIKEIYSMKQIGENPQVIVEEYLEGDFYSIDAYVMERGEVYYCPPVAYIPAQQKGINDFFLYKRFVPTSLTQNEIAAANEATKKSLQAVELRFSSAHVELVYTKNGWKIIEIGPRLGRFRHSMYSYAYGINHSLNDIRVHLGIKPKIPNKLLGHYAAYSIYTDRPGALKQIHGLDKLKNLKSTVSVKQYSHIGEECLPAKMGGHAIIEAIIANKDPEQFKKDEIFIEKKVRIDID